MPKKGGKRPGSGRKSRWGCPTTTIRVPVHLKNDILAFIEARMQENENVTESKPDTDATGYDSVTESKPDPLPVWRKANGRCQAVTTKGTRCKCPCRMTMLGFADGRLVDFAVCERHFKDHTWGARAASPHRSVLDGKP